MRVAVKSIFATLSCALLLVAIADAQMLEIGQLAYGTQASCDAKPKNCTAVGKVTGFQDSIGHDASPYSVSKDGYLVSWGVTLGSPGNWVDFFNGVFGTDPKARIVVLRKASGANRYKLVNQSETVTLSAYYGASPVVTLSSPIRVKANDIIGITLSTWAPLFRVNLPKNYSWRADRSQKSCSKVRHGVVHSRGVRPYDCVFNTAQLLYHAEVNTEQPQP